MTGSHLAPTQDEVVGVEVVWWLCRRPGLLQLGQLDGDCASDVECDVILNRENVLGLSIVMLRPKQRSPRRVGEPDRDAYMVGSAADTALDNISDIELAADLVRPRCLALVGKDGIARAHRNIGEPAEGGDNVLRQAIGEIIVVRRIGERDERQDGNRRAPRKYGR